jgi:tetratricopeptide (TPR) repeat protein
LRLSSDINIPSTRSTVQQTYDQVIADLKKAADLLPENSGYATRPNKISAYGALARVYLSMGAYVNAGKYADLYLTKQSTLMDYNTINVSASPVFPLFNPEYIYYSRPYLFTAATSLLGAKIDSVLYKSYAANDLRKSLFFSTNADGSIAFRGSYEGQAGVFASVPVDGICTDEMYLVRSECYARAGNKNAALDDLNALLIKRWKTNLFMGVTATDAADALTKILAERRKELLFRSVRWTDIRRLNLEGANITLQRLINGVVYTLPPNDLRYVELIPVEVLNLAPLPQNPR